MRSLGLVLALAAAACSPAASFGESGQGGAATSTGGSPASSGASGEGGDGGDGGPGGPAGGGLGGQGAGPGSGGASSSGATTSSTGGPLACDDATDCADQNPCTDDGCSLAGACTNTPRAPGTAGNPAEGACVGVCQVDPVCGLRIFSRAFESARTAWSTTTVSEAWGTSATAPPRTGISAVERLQGLDMMMVFTEAGMLHIRIGNGVWQAMPVTALFPAVTSPVIGTYAIQWVEGDPATEITIATPPDDGLGFQIAYVYEVTGGGAALLAGPVAVDRSDEPGAGPPSGDPIQWDFGVQRGFPPAVGFFVGWEQSGTDVYQYDENQTWQDYGLDVESPLWGDAAGGPASQSVVAAWEQGGVMHLVAP